MQNEQTSCTQSFTLEDDCKSLMNPLYFTSYLQVEKGRASNTKEVPVTISAAYSYDPTTQSYSEIIDLTQVTESVLTKDSATNQCTCSGFIREVHYTVGVAPKEAAGSIDRPYFELSNINATVVLSSKVATGACNSRQQVRQRYSIKFQSSNESGQFKSGNPGYIVGLPLLIGQPDPVTKAIQSYENGFRLIGADA